MVTPTAQQAFQIRLAWAERQSQSRAQWETPDAIASGGWLAREWLRAFASDEGTQAGGVPLLLSSLQEQTVWECILEETPAGSLLQPFGAARAARQAWRKLLEWKIDLSLVARFATEEAVAFARWASAFRERMRAGGWIDAGSAQWQIARSVRRPPAWCLAGFDIEPPSIRALAAELAVPASDVPAACAMGRARRVAAADATEEIERAAGWCRDRLLSDPRARLLVVVPDLETRRSAVELVFDSVLSPGHLLSPGRVFALEGGVRLDRHALVEAALTALELAAGPIAFERVSQWIRSPYLREGWARAAQRARIDVQLRQVLSTDVTLPHLLRQWTHASRKEPPDPLVAGMRELADVTRGPRNLSTWSSLFDGALRALGWPGDRVLDSGEQQTLEKFKQALGALGTLEDIVGPVDFNGARRQLVRIVRDTPFQPETGDVPVVVTSRLGDPAVLYEGLWIVGLHEAAWPRAPRPDPFLPWELQKRAGMPDASAEGTRALAGRITSRLIASAAEVVCSWPRRIEDEESLPSALIAELPLEGGGNFARRSEWRDAIHRAARIEELVDEQAPPLPRPARLRGGASVFRMQSLCPFRALAQIRLHARRLERPEPGIPARTKGVLVHRAMAQLWEEFGSLEALAALDDAPLQGVLRRIADSVLELVAPEEPGVSRDLIELESQRLAEVMREFLESERQRPPFRVVEREQAIRACIAGLEVQLYLDRVDELADGRRVVIDYKTGELSGAAWEGERPEEPQLPLYSIALQTSSPQQAPQAVTFGLVRAGECAFKGISAAPAAIPGLLEVADWPAQLTQWRATLERLAEAFAAGDARVDPKLGTQTCRQCHLQSLCRIDERVQAGVAHDAD